jgi:hypothetical protein
MIEIDGACNEIFAIEDLVIYVHELAIMSGSLSLNAE